MHKYNLIQSQIICDQFGLDSTYLKKRISINPDQFVDQFCSASIGEVSVLKYLKLIELWAVLHLDLGSGFDY